jgi:hypothetical protein
LSSYNAGLNYAQGLYNTASQGLQDYYGGPVALSQAQNNMAVNTGLNEYNQALNTAGMQNSYGLDTTQMGNAFNQQDFQDAFSEYQQKLKNQQNELSSIFGGLTGGISDLFGLGQSSDTVSNPAGGGGTTDTPYSFGPSASSLLGGANTTYTGGFGAPTNLSGLSQGSILNGGGDSIFGNGSILGTESELGGTVGSGLSAALGF